MDRDEGTSVCVSCGEVVEDTCIVEDLFDICFDVEETGYSLAKEEIKSEEITELENLCGKLQMPTKVTQVASELLIEYMKRYLN